MQNTIKYVVYAACISVMILNCYSKSNILIFGGNGFIGSECVNQLLEQNHTITLVSRGSINYDYETKIKPYVTHIKCDRYHGLSNCIGLQKVTQKYDFIIDFSAYHPVVIEDALNVLKKKFDTYIYISTDSVYEVCLPSENKFTKESDAKRYSPGILQDQANSRDSYGHFKLQGEEVLRQAHQDFGVRYIILRLPDVIGPRDTTFRWWAYQTWFQFYSHLKQPMHIPKHILSTSYVYVKDIGKIVTEIVRMISEGFHIENDVYNLAFPEAITLRQILDKMQNILGVHGVEYRYHDNAYYLYPSVTRGPIDTAKATRLLKWKSTSWTEAVNETIEFYKHALLDFPNERNEMLNKLKMFMQAEHAQLLVTQIEKHIAKRNSEQSCTGPFKDEL